VTFPTKLLAPGEEVYLDVRPNWSLLFWPVVIAVLVIAACIAVVVQWGSAPVWVGWVLVALVVIALVHLAAKLVMWGVTSFVLTSQRIIYRTGVLRRTGREIPIGRVQDVTYRQTLIERIVGAGGLTVESAGRSGQEPFPDIRKPAEVQALINRVVSRASGLGTGDSRSVMQPYSGPVTPPEPMAAAEPRAAESTIAQQLEQLAELHQHGVVTDAEYEQKRRELLDRL
jgi:membrane protein YdbS with pleckstrin-like domain